jgi:hypothetical protein
METYNFDILESNDFTIINNGTKNLYNLDEKKSYLEEIKSLSKFKGNKIEFPNMYGSLNFRDKGSGVFYDDSIGFFVCEGDSVEGNPSSVFLLSGPSYRNRGVNINKDNFLYITSYFSARLSINMDWKNQKDSYIFFEKQFEDDEIYDTIVYSLFNNSSFQCSARSVNYKNSVYDIKNEFFWLSVDEMKQLADLNGFDELYNDARTSSNRFIYEFFFGKENKFSKLSPTAVEVINKATNLLKLSFEIRNQVSNLDNQLFCWDAGYSQLKIIWKEYFPNEFKDFRETYKKLEKKMTERVYNLKFLK